jgi:hypothetical protein
MRVQGLGAAERRFRVLVVEGVGQLHSVIEPGLGPRVGVGDGKAARADARHHDELTLARS